MIHLSVATKASLIQDTGFGGYDLCINPYVGCQFGCSYCYVRFFVKDAAHRWGSFVRTRGFIKTKLPYELHKLKGQRLCIGTMTDPWQPIETTYNLTRLILQTISTCDTPPREIGIFTRSPLIRRDMQLLQQLNAKIPTRIHITITPFDRDILKRLEPIPVLTESRFKLVEDLKTAGLRTHIGVSPVLPIWSDPHIKPFADRIAQIRPDGFTVDPMQCYGEAYDATEATCGSHPQWPEVSAILLNKKAYKAWKATHNQAWRDAWAPYAQLPVLPMLMDHEAKTRTDARTGANIPFKDFNY